MGFYISSLSRAECGKCHLVGHQVKQYQTAPSYDFQWTDIHYLASRGNMEQLQSLLLNSDQEQIDRKDYYGKTPLYWAAYKGQRRCIELLLQYGADVNSRCKHGGSPLHAAIGLFPDCARLLIQHGADVNLKDNWGVTPMYLAACSGQIECIQLLVQAEAEITIRNKKTGEPPKQLASKTAFISWIENYHRHPRSLKHCARLQIRESLGHCRLSAIRTFNIPQSLKQYLMFEDLAVLDPM
ncbi:serine/threonine-protein phosphatase 6 regulatory ankyrin repeat subunit B-like [Protopterus annectens]|uniref:serine/threonine-protein phosphatase 6 regulatory ankyrin repeat subunit B-like n=1 Tax=Protopterus annectens TaxID=7888 RepID=UPI001CF93E53|nr:serine/threonine-protein phosphatase 6 regulatory ankyrin repeat subunit B-like [Protopterus annectens]